MVDNSDNSMSCLMNEDLTSERNASKEDMGSNSESQSHVVLNIVPKVLYYIEYRSTVEYVMSRVSVTNINQRIEIVFDVR
jgi:hypothetical protein